MGILNFSIRSQDIDFKDAVAGDTRQAKKTIKLEQGLKLRYLKLLHIYHNIDNTNITDGEGVSNNTVIFCKISFLNSKNSLFIEDMPFDRKEYMKEYNKKYRENNKEYYKEYQKEYQKEYKENLAEYRKEYMKEYKHTDKGLKVSRISHWRQRGVLDNFNDNYETLYKIYLSVKFCDICNCELNTNTKTRKCLDHCHESGYFRNIVCHCCNKKIG